MSDCFLDPSGSMAEEMCLLSYYAEDPGNSDSPPGMSLLIIPFKASVSECKHKDWMLM